MANHIVTAELSSVSTSCKDEPSKTPPCSCLSGYSVVSKKPSSKVSTVFALFSVTLMIFTVDALILEKVGWSQLALLLPLCGPSADYALFASLGFIGLHQLYRRSTARSGIQSPMPLRRGPRPGGGTSDRKGCSITRAAGGADGGRKRACGSTNSPTQAVQSRARSLPQWNQAIDAEARRGDVERAGRLLFELERPGSLQAPDVVSYNIVIRACAKKGDMQAAEWWLARMESKGIEATLCSYNTVLDACAKADNPDACEAWLQKMITRGVEANVISYATAIYAHARRSDEARAEYWFRRMQAAGVAPDAVSYNSMIHACGGQGNAEGAERWMKQMQRDGLDATVTTYTAVIDACAKAGDVPRAERWMETMIEKGTPPNVVSFSAMIDACAKACDPARAELWLEKMLKCNIKPNVHSYSAVINACAKNGDVDAAEDWLGKSELAGIANDVVIYSSVIDACGKAGDAERASKIFRRMQANEIRPHIIAYAALARPYAYRGEWTEVERIAHEMAVNGIWPNDYFLYAQILSYAAAKPRQSSRAEACFRQALQNGIKVNDHIVQALVRAVGRQRCTELMRELCHGRELPTPARRPPGSDAARRAQ